LFLKNSEVSYTIKPAENHHVDVLPSIERAAAEMFSLKDLPLKHRSDVTSRDGFQNARGRGFLWVAVDEHDVPVGFLLADIVDGNFHIKEMDVLPDLNGRGIGTRLLQCACNAACDQGYEYVTLTTFAHIAWNAPFYRRRGFSVMEAKHCGVELSAILLEENNSGLKNRVAMCKQCSS
jgi:GNAT superfamily N-acetyltransferase